MHEIVLCSAAMRSSSLQYARSYAVEHEVSRAGGSDGGRVAAERATVKSEKNGGPRARPENEREGRNEPIKVQSSCTPGAPGCRDVTRGHVYTASSRRANNTYM